MSIHVIVGAGPIGSATARLLADDGHEVRVLTRSGTGPAHERIKPISADATDDRRVADICAGATVLYNCANPPYHRWRTDWPPLAAALLRAAEKSGAVLVTMSNLYGYGEVSGPMREDLPLAAATSKGRVRAQMWRDAFAAHKAGLVRATEARASDFIGAGAHSLFTDMVAPAVRSGRRAHVPANFDVPHSVTYTGDAARMLVALGSDERAWAGRGTCRRHRPSPWANSPPGSPVWPEHPSHACARCHRSSSGWAASSHRWPASSSRCDTSSTGRSWSTVRPPNRPSD